MNKPAWKKTSFYYIKMLDYTEYFRGLMLRGEEIWVNEDVSLEIVFIGENWANRNRVFFMSRQADLVYELNVLVNITKFPSGMPTCKKPWELLKDFVDGVRKELDKD
mgnify:CR=1 FL=1